MFFQLNDKNPLLDLNTSVSELTIPFLIVAFVVSVLLGHAAFTDIFKGRIIKNYITLSLAVLSLALVPFVYNNIASHVLAAIAVIVFVLIIGAIGAVAMGDVKLYAALTLLIGKAGLYMLFLSWFIIILYSITIMYKAVQKAKKTGEKPPRGQRLGQAPGAPGIVIAFYITLVGVGVALPVVLALFGVSLLTVAGMWVIDKKWGLNIVPNQATVELEAEEDGEKNIADDVEDHLEDEKA